MTLGERMKRYEEIPKNYMMRRMPVIIRIDGCHFHTFTRFFDRPYDRVFARAMEETTVELCNQIQGCVLGYTQSDEISLVLCDYQKLDTAAWFDNQVEKICSVSASIASMVFNKKFRIYALDADSYLLSDAQKHKEHVQKYISALRNGGYFDSRCFNLSVDEVCNYLIWRQQDAERNSILALAQSMYSHGELQGISCKDLQNKMFSENGVNWSELDSHQKRGAVVARPEMTGAFVVYPETPVFKKSRDFVESRITFD